MEKRVGFLFDIDYLTQDGKPVIRLWCKGEDGNNFVALDSSFEPYFYALIHDYNHHSSLNPDLDGDASAARELIESIRVVRGGGEDEEPIRVKRVELTQRKLLGVNHTVLKVFAFHPRHVPLLREEVQKLGLVALEADILFVIRYLIDRRLRPFERLCVEGESIDLGYSEGIIAREVRSIAEDDERGEGVGRGCELSRFRLLAFDCEMAASTGVGMPSPKRDPIIIISVAYSPSSSGSSEDSSGLEMETRLFVMSDDEYRRKDDKRVISDFLQFIADFQPDILVGYNSDSFDWLYIRERARMHGIALRLGADGSTIQFERGGALPGVNITGRLNVDLFKLAKRDLGSVKVKTLENVAEYLGVMRIEERRNLSPREINHCWLSPSERQRQQLYEYARDDAVSTLGIAMKMLPLQLELSRMIGYPLDELAKMGRGRQVEAFLTAEAFKRGELVPQKRGGEKTYEGGFVLPPEKGLHENVIALDFSSMYPSIMIAFNISPDTYVEPGAVAGEEEVFLAPEVGHAFRKKPDGFFKCIMSELIARRRVIKSEMARYDKHSPEYRLLDVQQQSIKILTNSFYGYTGWNAAKFYKRECAEATTAWGRYFIKRTVDLAEANGLKVIYGDTDSIFVKLPPGSGDNDREKELLMAKAKEVAELISSELPLELEIQDFFKAIFFTGKKKRYAALTDRDEIVVRGLEVRRGDWCELAKEVQTRVIEWILKRKDPGSAVKYVKEVIKALNEGKIPLHKLIIYKTLTRRISGYETKQAHVIAAERALASNAHIYYDVGSKIPYIIIKGAGKTSERAFPVDIIEIEKSEGNVIYADERRYTVDIAYYIRHQIIPVAHRLLHLFGYDTSSFDDAEQKTLEHWF